MYGRGITFDGAFEFQAFAHCHDGHTMATQVAIDNQHVTTMNSLRRNGIPMFNGSNARGVNEQSVALPRAFRPIDVSSASYQQKTNLIFMYGIAWERSEHA